MTLLITLCVLAWVAIVFVVATICGANGDDDDYTPHRPVWK